jgi:hypothetical protein
MANPTGKGGFRPGQSGNPAGRPPKSRALTEILERGGAKTVLVDGKPMSGKRYIARALWELATTGRVTLPDGTSWTVDPKDWLDTVKWLYVHIDGPAKTETKVDLSGSLALGIVEEIVDSGDADRTAPSDSV